jgi:murein DD-endopeptidase MepM/ murein hydrolase activator NlpD
LPSCSSAWSHRRSSPDDEDDLNEQRSELSRDLNRANTDLDETSAALVRAAGASAHRPYEAGHRSTRARRHPRTAHRAHSLDDQMQTELEDAEQQLLEAEAAVERTDEEMEVLSDSMGDFVADSFQYGSPGLISLSVVINGGDASELGENLALADSVVGAQASTLDELSATDTVLQVEQERVEELRNLVATKREEAAENLVLKRELTQQAIEQAAAVRAIVATRSKAHQAAIRAKQVELDRIARLEASRERVARMLRALAAEEREQAAAEAAAAAANTTGTGALDTKASVDPDGFLAMPVAGGYVTSPYGMRMHPILRVYKLHDGTDFSAACGTPIYAAADGQVVSAYFDSAYGNRVILANGMVTGASLATSYNHLTSDTVSIGQSVKRGQVIGYAGTTGYSTGCHLHFMVYRNGATTDPIPWVS